MIFSNETVSARIEKLIPFQYQISRSKFAHDFYFLISSQITEKCFIFFMKHVSIHTSQVVRIVSLNILALSQEKQNSKMQLSYLYVLFRG